MGMRHLRPVPQTCPTAAGLPARSGSLRRAQAEQAELVSRIAGGPIPLDNTKRAFAVAEQERGASPSPPMRARSGKGSVAAYP